MLEGFQLTQPVVLESISSQQQQPSVVTPTHSLVTNHSRRLCNRLNHFRSSRLRLVLWSGQCQITSNSYFLPLSYSPSSSFSPSLISSLQSFVTQATTSQIWSLLVFPSPSILIPTAPTKWPRRHLLSWMCVRALSHSSSFSSLQRPAAHSCTSSLVVPARHHSRLGFLHSLTPSNCLAKRAVLDPKEWQQFPLKEKIIISSNTALSVLCLHIPLPY